MQTTGNTILITGGGSGIGRGLAETFHNAGNRVIIAGRRRELLDEVVAANPGMAAETFDVDNADAIKSFAAALLQKYPALNAVIHNAGIMRDEDLKAGDPATAEATVETNLLGPIRLNSALLPHLLQQPAATVLTVTSGLAFVPLSLTPTYCATKAAIHSYTQSLRYQMQGTSVQVIELAPPYVQTELTGEHQKNDPAAMPLNEYIAETFGILRDQPQTTEVLVERVKLQRFAEARGEYESFYQKMNEARLKSRAARQQ